MNRDLIVTLADKNYIDQAKQLFSSVYWNAGWKGDYMLLSHEIPEKDLKWFRDKGILVKKCNFLDKEKFSMIPRNKGEVGGYSHIILDKFYLFTLEFKKWKNIVYLDPDMIVKDCLYRLTKVEKFSAVPDFYAPKIKNQVLHKKYFNKFNLDADAFNSNVIAFPSKIIKEDTFKRLYDLAEKYMRFSRYYEQLILNIYFKWEKLPQSYNIFPMLMLLRGIKKDEIIGEILNFPDIGFPHCHCWDKKNPFYNEWKENLNKALIDFRNI